MESHFSAMYNPDHQLNNEFCCRRGVDLKNMAGTVNVVPNCFSVLILWADFPGRQLACNTTTAMLWLWHRLWSVNTMSKSE
jgi:hypothetical protein